MKFIHKLKNGQLPRYLSEMVTYNFNIHEYPTRSRTDFRVECKRDSKSSNSLFHRGLIQFNALPVNIKNERSEGIFKEKLRRFIKENF